MCRGRVRRGKLTTGQAAVLGGWRTQSGAGKTPDWALEPNRTGK
jgi:hypothetical protein